MLRETADTDVFEFLDDANRSGGADLGLADRANSAVAASEAPHAVALPGEKRPPAHVAHRHTLTLGGVADGLLRRC